MLIESGYEDGRYSRSLRQTALDGVFFPIRRIMPLLHSYSLTPSALAHERYMYCCGSVACVRLETGVMTCRYMPLQHGGSPPAWPPTLLDDNFDKISTPRDSMSSCIRYPISNASLLSQPAIELLFSPLHASPSIHKPRSQPAHMSQKQCSRADAPPIAPSRHSPPSSPPPSSTAPMPPKPT